MARHAEAISTCRAATDGTFRLADHATDWVGTPDLPEARKSLAREQAEDVLEENRGLLIDAQERLWANDTWGVLVVFQAMDAAGKDGTIKHVMSGVNPQGVEVTSFKVPSAQELDHDYLWRYWGRLPERGRIGIFNRSYYEEVLVVRVHPELVERQRLPSPRPRGQDGDHLWRHRYEDICAFERYLDRNGIKVVKFFLHLSREEQRQRFLARIDRPEKNWKFSAADVAERRHWDDYQHAYEHAIRHTSTEHAPWWVIPADRKWLMRALVSEVLAQEITGLGLEAPRLVPEEAERLAEARAELVAEAPEGS